MQPHQTVLSNFKCIRIECLNLFHKKNEHTYDLKTMNSRISIKSLTNFLHYFYTDVIITVIIICDRPIWGGDIGIKIVCVF